MNIKGRVTRISEFLLMSSLSLRHTTAISEFIQRPVLSGPADVGCGHTRQINWYQLRLNLAQYENHEIGITISLDRCNL